MAVKITVRKSPNQSARNPPGPVRLVICHTPEGSDQGTIATILDPKAEVSYHELTLVGGREVVQFVEFSRKAWHALTYNSLSDGLACHGWARQFDLKDASVQTFSERVARRLHARGLKPQWTTDPRKGGFCRHGDIQDNRTDPTPDMAEWKLFVGMVEADYQLLATPPVGKPWPVPIPRWYWKWALWHLQGRKGPRPSEAPKLIPLWAWRRLRAQQGLKPL